MALNETTTRRQTDSRIHPLDEGNKQKQARSIQLGTSPADVKKATAWWHNVTSRQSKITESKTKQEQRKQAVHHAPLRALGDTRKCRINASLKKGQSNDEGIHLRDSKPRACMSGKKHAWEADRQAKDQTKRTLRSNYIRGRMQRIAIGEGANGRAG